MNELLLQRNVKLILILYKQESPLVRISTHCYSYFKRWGVKRTSTAIYHPYSGNHFRDTARWFPPHPPPAPLASFKTYLYHLPHHWATSPQNTTASSRDTNPMNTMRPLGTGVHLPWNNNDSSSSSSSSSRSGNNNTAFWADFIEEREPHRILGCLNGSQSCVCLGQPTI